jgi:hypothetical protein
MRVKASGVRMRVKASGVRMRVKASGVRMRVKASGVHRRQSARRLCDDTNRVHTKRARKCGVERVCREAQTMCHSGAEDACRVMLAAARVHAPIVLKDLISRLDVFDAKLLVVKGVCAVASLAVWSVGVICVVTTVPQLNPLLRGFVDVPTPQCGCELVLWKLPHLLLCPKTVWLVDDTRGICFHPHGERHHLGFVAARAEAKGAWCRS